jgi:hypothetical protein
MEGGIWFRHDADSGHDVRMIAMQARWDLQGIGAYWRIVELLRANGGRIQKDDLEAVHISLRWDHAPDWLNWCLARGLLEQDDKTIYSSRMLREIQEYETFRAERRAAGIKGASARWHNHSSANSSAIVPGMAKNATDKTRQDRADKTLKDSQPSGWDEWWNAYPRKVGKVAAIKSYARALKTVSPQALKDGLDRAVKGWAAAGTEPQYIPHPATWLNGGRWEDQPPAQVPGRVAKTGPLLIDSTPGKDYGKSGRW